MQKINGVEIHDDVQVKGFEDLFKYLRPEKDPDQYLDIPLDRLVEFKNHPFRVADNKDMAELVESVKEQGVLSPGIARELPDGNYEIISGHRRKRAAELAGLDKMMFYVGHFTDEEATAMMVDSNIQREDILPSEKAKAYKMRYEAMKSQGKKGSGKKLQILVKESNESRTQIQRYISLTRLIKPLLDRVDSGEIRITQAVLIADLKRKEQEQLEIVLLETQCHISIAQAKEMKQLSFDRELTQEKLAEILKPVKKEEKPKQEPGRKVVFTEQTLKRFFPGYMREDDIKKVIIDLLETWRTSIQIEEK